VKRLSSNLIRHVSGVLMACLIMAGGQATAAGFAMPDQSASALGLANNFVAQADDPSALAYNPAGIAWQPGTGLMVGGSTFYRSASAELTVGGSANNEGGIPTLWQLYGAWMPLDGDWGLGLGVNTPYALENDWQNTSFGDSRVRLLVYHASVDVIYAISSNLAVAAGGDAYYGRMDLDSATSRFHGSDPTSFGGHGSVMWRPWPSWSFGAMFRSGATLNPDGDATGSTVNGPAEVSLRLPEEARIGVAYDILDGLKVEIDGTWMRWSALKGFNLIGASAAESNPFELDDSFGAGLGVTWTWREEAQFRFGYAFEQGSSNQDAFSPFVADADSHRASFGVGATLFGAHVDLAYAFSFYPNFTVDAGGSFDGKYRDRRHALMVSVSKRF
jgi:long-chain fatty acid transport protein